MIHRATFQNFKSLRDVTITFDRRLTVLVGPNGCGKTSALKGIETAAGVSVKRSPADAFAEIRLSDAFSGLPGEPISFDLAGTCGSAVDETSSIHVRIPTGTNGQIGNPTFAITVAGETFNEAKKLAADRFLGFGPSVFLRLTPQVIARPSLTQSKPPTINQDGAGVASVLGHLKMSDDVTYDAVVKKLREVIKNVEGIRIDRLPVVGGGQYGEAVLFDLKGRRGVPAAQMSDGSLFALGLITYLASASRPRLLLLDDLDHGLHPKAQKELIGVLRKFLDEYPDLQIVASSHSLYILHHLDPEEVRVMALRDDGSAVCAPLGDHPDFQKWKDDMTPGEFWSHFGEKWLLDREPVGAGA